jgi:hypothetical protein
MGTLSYRAGELYVTVAIGALYRDLCSSAVYYPCPYPILRRVERQFCAIEFLFLLILVL